MRIETPLFRLTLPEGWRWIPDDEGGAAVPPGDPGAMVFFAQPVEDPAELPSLHRMLSGFLLQRGLPVDTLQLASVRSGTFNGFGWQYVDEPEGGDPHAWSLWITGHKAAWLLITYNCPGAVLASHWHEVLDLLATVELAPEPPGAP